MDTKKVGIIAEAKVVARLLELGFTVFTPIGGYGPVDAIISKDGELVKGQIKNGKTDGVSVVFSTIDCGRNRASYHGHADVFWVYCPNTEKVYEIPVKIAPKKSMRLRLGNACKPGRRNVVNKADDFLL